MFDIGSTKLILVAVIALIAIGPKELPGVLRTVGQWMGKARKMAAEFQGQFQEAMREAEMADLKKSFDDIKDAATTFRGGNLMTSLQKDVSDSLRIDKPAEISSSATIEPQATVLPTTPEAPTPATFIEAEVHMSAGEPLAITGEVQPVPEAHQQATQASVAQDIAQTEALKDTNAS